MTPRQYNASQSPAPAQSAIAASGRQINGSGGVVRHAAITGEPSRVDCQRDVAICQSRATRPTSALNPADPWPFTKIAPESEREFISSLPEALF